ncbi:methyltransferase, FxLD system [Streptomyces tsukubensis]|uniref:methyltransferase, FxLD system n=1 Tax=Streptomyces tsukubensis TaxID=83656 RepID=UPI00344C5E3A
MSSISPVRIGDPCPAGPGPAEKEMLARHVPAPGGGRALDAGSGSGRAARYLAEMGYEVDAVDRSPYAIVPAAGEQPPGGRVTWIHADIEHGDPVFLHPGGYDLILLRRVYELLGDRTRVMHDLCSRLRPNGALVVITRLLTGDSPDGADGAVGVDEREIALLTEGWEHSVREDCGDGLVMLILRGPCPAPTRAVERRTPATGIAVTAAVAVVTDAAGRVLLGYSQQDMHELPGGKPEGAEPYQQAAVRELEEETGLIADPADAHVVALLVDAAQGVPRITAVVRITKWTGTLTTREPEKVHRWEWHPLHTLAVLGPVFTPSAQALQAVWPGTIPQLPAVTPYPQESGQPPVPGEPPQALRLREEMADAVTTAGWARSGPVREALRQVPRHRFMPEQPMEIAYDQDRAPVTRRTTSGRAASSVSAPWLQADMLESLRIRPDAIVFEAGSGGYNAHLLAHVTGAGGRVVTGDIDPYVVQRTRRFTTEAGRGTGGHITVFQGDAALGAPAHLVPRGGFDAAMVTYNCHDVAPAWREQLAQDGHLVLPLEIHGYTRAIALQRRGDVLHARGFTHCGFVPAQGAHARTTPALDLLDGELRLLSFEGDDAGTDRATSDTAFGLEKALHGPRHETGTGVTVAAGEYFGSLQLYLATTLPDFRRLDVDRSRDSGVTRIAKGGAAPALAQHGSLAYLTHTPTTPAHQENGREWEFRVHAFGDHAPALTELLTHAVRTWDRTVRNGPDPALTIHPAHTPDHQLPPGHRNDKPHSRLVFCWPGQGAPGPAKQPIAADASS